MTEFDVAFTRFGSDPNRMSMNMNIPAQIGRSLIAAGYNRAKLTVTDKGILVRPYVSDNDGSNRRSHKQAVALPDWSKA